MPCKDSLMAEPMAVAEDPSRHGDCAQASGGDFPANVLTQLFESLPLREFVSAIHVCKQWRSVAAHLWQQRVEGRWEYMDVPQWRKAYERGTWYELYRHLHQAEAAVLHALEDACWPERRSTALGVVREHSEVAKHVLAQELAPDCGVPLGRRYWALQLRMQALTHRACTEMRRLTACNDAMDHLARCVLFVADVHFPLQDNSWVLDALDQLTQELRRRMQEAGVSGGRRALQLASQLLFGAPEHGRSRGLSPPEAGRSRTPGLEDGMGQAPQATASWSALSSTNPASQGGAGTGQPGLTGALDRGPGRASMHGPGWTGYCDVPQTHGIGLQGNSQNYYEPANSLLNSVLQRGLGIPITLAVVYVVVCRAAGLDVGVLGVPRHVVVKQSGGGTDEDLYVDAFGGGAVMDEEAFRHFLNGIGVEYAVAPRTVMSCAEVCERLCYNLLATYHDARSWQLLHLVAALAASVASVPRWPLMMRSHAAVSLELYDDALEAIEQLQHTYPASASTIHKQIEETKRQVTGRKLMQLACRPLVGRRTADVAFRVGQVVAHRQQGFIGVVVGWDAGPDGPELPTEDPRSAAPQHAQGTHAAPAHHQQAAQPDAARTFPTRAHPSQPRYSVLVDERFRPENTAYVAQDHLRPVLDAELDAALAPHPPMEGYGEEAASAQLLHWPPRGILHPRLGVFFEGLTPDGCRYLPNSFLRAVYPDDWCREDLAVLNQRSYQ